MSRGACARVCKGAWRIWAHLYVQIFTWTWPKVFLSYKKCIILEQKKCDPIPRNAYFLWYFHLIRAFSIDDIPARTREGASIIHMILNNLDKAVAQFPQELVTYGGNGQVFSNWAQVSKLLILDHFYSLNKLNVNQL